MIPLSGLSTANSGAPRENLSSSEARLVGLLVLMTFLLRLAALPRYPVPPVIIHDEFANILGAQTFLVFVDQREDANTHTLHEIWVRNPPDLETAPILWAWHLSPSEDKKVISRYKNRTVWYLRPDTKCELI
jgi:hypothetical protein